MTTISTVGARVVDNIEDAVVQANVIVVQERYTGQYDVIVVGVRNQRWCQLAYSGRLTGDEASMALGTIVRRCGPGVNLTRCAGSPLMPGFEQFLREAIAPTEWQGDDCWRDHTHNYRIYNTPLSDLG